MLGGDEGAFDEFFEDYFPRLFRFAVLRLRDQDAAEDLVQNSLIAAVRNLGSWRGEATLFTWLCTICRREISAWEKRTSRRATAVRSNGSTWRTCASATLPRACSARPRPLSRCSHARATRSGMHSPPS